MSIPMWGRGVTPALIFGTIFLLASPVLAQSPWMSKLDGGARALVHADQRSPAAVSAPTFSDFDLSVDRTGHSETGLFVRLNDINAASVVAAAGMEIQTVAGLILVGRAPVSALAAIAQVPEVVSVSASRRSRTQNDAANASTGVDLVHVGTGLPEAYDGSGVIVGVIDTGIDITHPAFRHEDGSTRILQLIELEAAGASVWTQNEINQALASPPGSITHLDFHGHGTHVAGTAAGSPFPSVTYVGAAPAADLIIVKADRDNGGFGDTDVVASVATVCGLAALYEQPAVVNLSLGGLIGPLDGTSDYEQALSHFAGAGCIILAAAGNSGNFVVHAGYDAEPALTREIIAASYVNPEEGSDGTIVLDFWFTEEAVEEVTFVLYGPGPEGPVEVAITEAISIDLDDPSDFEFDFIVGQEVIGMVQTLDMGRDPNNGDGRLFLELSGAEGTLLTWFEGFAFGLRASGSAAGRIDAWLPRAAGDGTQFFLIDPPVGVNVVNGDVLQTVGSPSTAHDVITVAAYTTKNSWVDGDGVQQFKLDDNTNEPSIIGDRAFFSSIGPTRDGRLGVDVSAPGNILASALSGASSPAPSRILAGALHTMMEGTSMATPHAAGIVALMLQANPELDAEDVTYILHDTARLDDFTGSEPNVWWGYGKIDALAAVQSAVQVVSADPRVLVAGLTLDAPFPNPARNNVDFAFNLPVAGEASLEIYDILGRRVSIALDGELPAGPHRARVDVAGFASGTYVARLSIDDGSSVTHRFTVVR